MPQPRSDESTTREAARPPAQGRRIRGLDAEQRRQRRRKQLLEATLELVAANGYLNTSIEQICQEAYVGTRGFYEIFDNKEECYLALLQEVSERIEAGLVAVLRDAPADEAGAIRALLSAFAHALVDDPRLARITFGEASGISPTVERQRRVNRRWAADFLQAVWRQLGVIGEADARPVAVGVIGGLFDLVADWMVGVDQGAAGSRDVDSLIDDMSAFYQAVRHGIGALES